MQLGIAQLFGLALPSLLVSFFDHMNQCCFGLCYLMNYLWYSTTVVASREGCKGCKLLISSLGLTRFSLARLGNKLRSKISKSWFINKPSLTVVRLKTQGSAQVSLSLYDLSMGSPLSQA